MSQVENNSSPQPAGDSKIRFLNFRNLKSELTSLIEGKVGTSSFSNIAIGARKAKIISIVTTGVSLMLMAATIAVGAIFISVPAVMIPMFISAAVFLLGSIIGIVVTAAFHQIQQENQEAAATEDTSEDKNNNQFESPLNLPSDPIWGKWENYSEWENSFQPTGTSAKNNTGKGNDFPDNPELLDGLYTALEDYPNANPSENYFSSTTSQNTLNAQGSDDYPQWEDMPEVTDDNNPNNGLNTNESDPYWEENEK
ncbi:MAG: hypothetical protein K2L13_03390 [Opitutales bacterium]|nr:hypothetical protein [Opitutales bacterium]